MKLKYLIILLFLGIVPAAAQQYPEVTIMDIQYQHPDSLLLLGDRPSPLNGDTVTIVGVVMNNPYRGSNPDSATVLIAGAPALYLQDTSETDFGGILVRYVGASPSAAFNTLDTGKIIRITGYVEEYYVTTQFQAFEFDFDGIIGQMQRPAPVVIPLDSLAQLGSNLGKILAEKWEGVLVESRDVTVATTGTIGSGSWSVTDANNTEVIIGNQSSYIRNSTPPAVASVLEYVRGYIQNRDNLPFGYGHIINPVYFSDYKVGTYPPTISGVTRNPGVVGFGQAVTVNAQITDLDGTVANARIHYRKNQGQRNIVNMTNQGGNLWSGTIPAQSDSSLIDYYIRAEDNQGYVSTNPVDTVRNLYFYLVLNRDLTIQDVQYSPFGGGWSGYNSYTVTIKGIVTADTTDFSDTNHVPIPNIYIQNGTGPWSGIQVFGSQAIGNQKGDELSVTGVIEENFSVTRINLSSVQLLSTGNQLPEAQSVTAFELGAKPNGTVSAEKWEGVLVKFTDLTVQDENADGEVGPHIPSVRNNFGEMYIMDATGDSVRVELQDGDHLYHNYWSYSLTGLPIYVRTGDTFDELRGIMYFSFTNYKLIPRTDADFIGYTPVSVDDQKNLNPDAYSLLQNYPNPFNPATTIMYTIPAENLVTLKIYNMLGEEVSTLVNEVKTAGTHSISFNARNLTSGVYFYSISAGNYSAVKKMMILK